MRSFVGRAAGRSSSGRGRLRRFGAVAVAASAFGFAQAAAAASWTTQSIPDAGGGALLAVSCPSATSCVAVGQAVSSGARKSSKVGKSRTPFAELWDGSSWTIESIPTPASGGVLRGVSCTSPTACIAVGQTGGLRPTGTLTERWDGSSWTIEPSPSPGQGVLSGVSCTSASACVAVGEANRRSGGFPYRPLVELWNGRQWAVQRVPAPHGGFLNGVSCASATTCMAVGYGLLNRVEDTPFVERWNGSRWTYGLPPHPAHGGMLAGVSCPAANACVATGTSPLSFTTAKPLAESWDGSRWRIARAPRRAGSDDYLVGGISCASASACTAVGGAVYGIRRLKTVAESWNGRRWTIQQTPNPANGGGLFGVSCTAAQACIAVGSFGPQGGPNGPLAERYG